MPSIQCSAVLFDLDGTVPSFPLKLILAHRLNGRCGWYNSLKVPVLTIAHWTDFAEQNSLDPAVILATSHGFHFCDMELTS
jgi:hypothetical protein